MSMHGGDETFDGLLWHDNYVYGLAVSLGDIERGDWRSDLVLDIDHIVEWVCEAETRPRFRVAPATLTFHDVTDLRIDLDWGDSGGRVAVSEASIHVIDRSSVVDQKICFDRPYYRWRIDMNVPFGGKIAFGATGFTQLLHAEPLLIDEQKLTPSQRAGLLRG